MMNVNSYATSESSKMSSSVAVVTSPGVASPTPPNSWEGRGEGEGARTRTRKKTTRASADAETTYRRPDGLGIARPLAPDLEQQRGLVLKEADPFGPDQQAERDFDFA